MLVCRKLSHPRRTAKLHSSGLLVCYLFTTEPLVRPAEAFVTYVGTAVPVVENDSGMRLLVNRDFGGTQCSWGPWSRPEPCPWIPWSPEVSFLVLMFTAVAGPWWWIPYQPWEGPLQEWGRLCYLAWWSLWKRLMTLQQKGIFSCVWLSQPHEYQVLVVAFWDLKFI